MGFGAPLHKINDQLMEAAHFLQIDTKFVVFNTVILILFEHPQQCMGTKKHFIQKPQRLDLARLQTIHAVFSEVISDKIPAHEGTRQLNAICASNSEAYQPWHKVVLAFLAGFAISPMGFSGSLADGLVAGFCSGSLMLIQLLRGGDTLFAGIFE